MNEFVRLGNRDIMLANPSREYPLVFRRLRTFSPETKFQYAADDDGDVYIHSIGDIRLRYQAFEQSNSITYWQFADGTSAYSYLVDSGNDRTRRFISELWEIKSCIRELNLKALG